MLKTAPIKFYAIIFLVSTSSIINIFLPVILAKFDLYPGQFLAKFAQFLDSWPLLRLDVLLRPSSRELVLTAWYLTIFSE